MSRYETELRALKEEYTQKFAELEETRRRDLALHEEKFRTEIEAKKYAVEVEKKKEVDAIMRQHLEGTAKLKAEQEQAVKNAEEEFNESLKVRANQMIVRYEKEKQEVIDDCAEKIKKKEDEQLQLKEAIGNHLVHS